MDADDGDCRNQKWRAVTEVEITFERKEMATPISAATPTFSIIRTQLCH